MSGQSKVLSAAEMQAVGRALDSHITAVAGERLGFLVLVFPFDGPGMTEVNYISNAERGSMKTALKEIVARLDGQPEISGRA